MACSFCTDCPKKDDENRTIHSTYSFKEWLALLYMPNGKQKNNEIKRVFKLIDTDGDKIITKQELRRFFKNMDGFNKTDRKELIADKFFKRIDED